jgi:hypothetical protein
MVDASNSEQKNVNEAAIIAQQRAAATEVSAKIRNDIVQRIQSEVARLRMGPQSRDIEQLISDLDGLASGILNGTVNAAVASTTFADLKVQADREKIEAAEEQAEQHIKAGMVLDNGHWAQINDANRRTFYDSFIDVSFTKSQHQFVSDTLMSISKTPVGKEIERMLNASTKEAKDAAEKEIKALIADNKSLFDDVKGMHGYGAEAEAFLGKIERSGHFNSKSLKGWLIKIRNGEEITDDDWKNLNGEITESMIKWKELGAVTIGTMAEKYSDEAAFCKEMGGAELYRLRLEHKKYFEEHPEAKAEFEKIYAKYKANPDWSTLSKTEKEQIAAFDVVEPTAIVGFMQAIANRAQEIDRAVERINGLNLTADEIAKNPYYQNLTEKLNGKTGAERHTILVDLAKDSDATIALYAKTNETAFEAAKVKYISQFVDAKASVVVQGVQMGTLKSVAQSEPIAKALENKATYDAKFQQALEQNKDTFMARVDSMMDAEAKAPDATQGKYPYTATLREIRAFDVYSKGTIALMKEMAEGKISGDEAYVKWQKTKDVDYDANIGTITQSINAQLSGKYPELVGRFNKMDFEKDIEPLILKLNTDEKLLNEVRKNVDNYVGGTVAWSKFSPEQQALLVAYMSKDPIHLASESLCSYGPNGVCHAPGLMKEGNEKDALQKAEVKASEPPKIIAPIPVPAILDPNSPLSAALGGQTSAAVVTKPAEPVVVFNPETSFVFQNVLNKQSLPGLNSITDVKDVPNVQSGDHAAQVSKGTVQKTATAVAHT